jgi:hypothetical protein
VIFALTFLTSTWYIKNPFLKAKINEVRFSVSLDAAKICRRWEYEIGGILRRIAVRKRQARDFGTYAEHAPRCAQEFDTSVDSFLYWYVLSSKLGERCS